MKKSIPSVSTWILLLSIFITAARLLGQTYRIPTHFALLLLPFAWAYSTKLLPNFFVILVFLLGLFAGHLLLTSITLPSDVASILPLQIFPYGIYYIYVWAISIAIALQTPIHDGIQCIERLSIAIIIFGILFWLISITIRVPLFVDESASIYRLSSLMSEPSYIAIPSSILLTIGMLKKSYSEIILSIFAILLSFSPTCLITGISVLFIQLIPAAASSAKRLSLGRLQTKLFSTTLIIALILVFTFPIISPIFYEIQDNVNSFLLHGNFIDGRAINANNFYLYSAHISFPIGFGIGSSQKVSEFLGYPGVFDNSIFVTIDMTFGYYIGILIKILYLLSFFSLLVYSSTSSFSRLPLNYKFVITWIPVWLIFSMGSYSQPYILSLLIFLVVSCRPWRLMHVNKT